MIATLRRALLSRVISLYAQLLLTMVGLVVATIAGLIIVAYGTSVGNLEAEATRNVRLAAETRARSLTELLESRHQRANSLLAGVESICAEPRPGGGFGWGEECTSIMVQGFAQGEGATGSVLRYRSRTIGSYGQLPPAGVRAPGAVGWLVKPSTGAAEYVVQATRDEITIELLFSGADIRRFFDDRSGLGSTGEVFLMDGQGGVLTPPRYAPGGTRVPGARVAESRPECTAGPGAIVDVDYRGVQTFHGFTPAPALGSACVDAHIAYDEALAPAEQLRIDLAWRGLRFALLGVLASLIAARLTTAPVLRLVEAARALQAGEFGRQVPLGGPHEVRELGRAFAVMGRELAAMIKGEQAARREAEAANRSKDRFLAMLSHEMRTPLSAILGWTRLLRSGRLDQARAARALGAVERSADAQRRLIDDLLDVSRIVAGRLRMVRSPVSLATVASAAIEAVRPLAEERGVLLQCDVDRDDVTVMGDALRLQQVVWNLAWNAIKFSRRGGIVRVTLDRTGDAARLAVSDTGVGIAAEFLPHVFEWYRQDETGRGLPEAGLGLGLALVRQLVDLHGGTVHAESAGEGKGATFVVTLPVTSVVDAVAAHAEASPGTESRPLLDGVRVLVVEDDEATRLVVRAVLEDAGATVNAAATAQDGRRELSALTPDVLISDIAMQEEDGYTFMRGLRASAVDTPAIALTSWARREDVERAKDAGFQLHLAKPLDPDRLVQAVSSLARPSRPRET
jgi:signal transduction histidine kinase